LRIELPLLNTKLKKLIYKNKIKMYSNLNNFNSNLSPNVKNLQLFITSKQKLNLVFLYKKINLNLFYLKNNYNSLSFIFGNNFFVNNNKYFINYIYNKYTNYYRNLLVYLAISNLAYLNNIEFGKINNLKTYLKNSLVFLNNIDDETFLNTLINNNNFIVYNGSFFDKAALISNLIFPIQIFFEYSGYFLNIFGNLRKSNKVISSKTFLYTPADFFNNLLIFIRNKFISYSFFFNKFKRILFYFKFIKID
jgi:hypothetical protein